MPPVIVGAPIANFRQADAWLYRGGQPDAEGMRYLNELGVRTIISFRWWKSAIITEKLAAQAFGIAFESIPLNYWTYPSLEVVDRFLALLDDQQKRPIYMHCKHGSDRTGVMLAVYRMARQGWTANQAYREMKACGFHLYKMYHFKWAVYMFEGYLSRWKNHL